MFNMDTARSLRASSPPRIWMTLFDAERKRVYVAGGEGFVSVFQENGDKFTDMGKFESALGTRTGVWYVKRDRLYIAAPPARGLGARLLVYEAQSE